MSDRPKTSSEIEEVRRLFRKLCRQPRHPFPAPGESLQAPLEQGVYIIRDPSGAVAHVGRSRTGKRGLRGRLNNHLQGQSSFVIYHLDQDGSRLRKGFTYQYLIIPDRRTRALVEALGAGMLCPLHMDGKRD